MDAPVNAKLKKPTILLPSWESEAQGWINLNKKIGGNPDFFPNTIKGAYVIGVIYEICECVEILLSNKSRLYSVYIPAYGLFASSVELLGRCINGNTTTSGCTDDLAVGMKWIFSEPKNRIISHKNIIEEQIVVQTRFSFYSLQQLTALRHFSLHGQATSKQTGPNEYQFGQLDTELLVELKPLFANALDEWWKDLQCYDALCNCLAKANILAIRDLPIYKSWSLFKADKFRRYHSVEEIFGSFNW